MQTNTNHRRHVLSNYSCLTCCKKALQVTNRKRDLTSVAKSYREAGVPSYQVILSVGTGHRCVGSSYKAPRLGRYASRDWVPLSSYSGIICRGWTR